MDHTHNLHHHETSQNYVPSHERWWRRGLSDSRGDPGGEMQQNVSYISNTVILTPVVKGLVTGRYSYLIDST